MGTIVAIQNNNLGIAGIKNIERNNIFSNDAFDSLNEDGRAVSSDISQLDGLYWNVVHGAKVINVSMGVSLGENGDRAAAINLDYDEEMQRLLDLGYDYVIIQSAGNSSIHSEFNGCFSYVQTDSLRERIITVGAINRNRELPIFTNHGNRIDVVAPGVSIWSTGANNNAHYYFNSGTSMAAPHVAGVAAMVWSVDPALSGEQVKDIILRSADNNSRRIRETRRNADLVDPTVREFYNEVDALAAVQLARGEDPRHDTGRLVGLVVRATEDNALGEPISNATIALYSKPNNTLTATTHSDPKGHYHMDDIKPGKYYFYIKAEGYELEQVNVTIEPGVITNIHKLKLPKKDNGNSQVEGNVVDSRTGARPISPVSLEFRRGIDPDLSEKAEIIQSDNGKYSIELPAGNYTVTARADGYVPTTSYVLSYGENKKMDNQTVTISPKLEQGTSSFRAVLTWGKDPRDLDSHLVGPTPDGNKFHIYYANKNYHYQGELYNNLDVDDTSSYGPETVTMNKLVDGTYDYYVHDFTNRTVTTSTRLSLSEARIQLYDDQGNTVRTFNVPSTSGAGTIWHVFTLIVKDGEYTIIPVDKLSNKIISPENIGTRGSGSDNTNQNIDLFDLALTQEEKDAKIKARQQDGVQGDNLDLELNKQDQKIEELNQDNTTDPDNNDHPNDPNDTTPTQEDLSIKILSIPTGKVDKDIIDMTYLAIPSDKATISQISYTINDRSEQVIYKLQDHKTIGELGKAQIQLIQGENNIKFKVIDTSGKTIVYELPEKLYYE